MKAEIEFPKITPSQLAEIFWEMDDAEQAVFFNHVGTMALTTSAYGMIGSFVPLDMQMFATAKHANMTPLGIRVMECINGNTEGHRALPLHSSLPKINQMRKGIPQ